MINELNPYLIIEKKMMILVFVMMLVIIMTMYIDN